MIFKIIMWFYLLTKYLCILCFQNIASKFISWHIYSSFSTKIYNKKMHLPYYKTIIYKQNNILIIFTGSPRGHEGRSSPAPMGKFLCLLWIPIGPKNTENFQKWCLHVTHKNIVIQDTRRGKHDISPHASFLRNTYGIAHSMEILKEFLWTVCFKWKLLCSCRVQILKTSIFPFAPNSTETWFNHA